MKILSPAKINLFLQITGKRSDGYHDLASLMCCISLYDEITLEFGKGKIEIQCSDPQVPHNETNLAFRAANVFFDNFNKKEGLKISIRKRIPVAGGLGGGSSNAASVLLALNRFYGDPFSHAQLMALGLSLGADVPFFLFQKPAIATGIGDKLESFASLPHFHVLLICQKFGVCTADIYRNLNLRLTKCKKKFTKTPLKKDGFDPALHLCNDLETVTIPLYPAINSAKMQLLNHGALGALMSGSGPSVFGLFADLSQAESALGAIGRSLDVQLYLVDLMVDSNLTSVNS